MWKITFVKFELPTIKQSMQSMSVKKPHPLFEKRLSVAYDSIELVYLVLSQRTNKARDIFMSLKLNSRRIGLIGVSPTVLIPLNVSVRSVCTGLILGRANISR
jgi:hypothetical protein